MTNYFFLAAGFFAGFFAADLAAGFVLLGTDFTSVPFGALFLCALSVVVADLLA